METIRTFVFIDLETTGLPHCGPSKITEIAFVAAGREQILEKHEGVAKENNIGVCFLPRVLNKINFTIYPCKMIHPSASTVSGLTNENLEHQKPFDDSMFNIIRLYLERLEKPLCLVAHNGDRFDFPILMSELVKIGKELPNDMYCVDSLPAFRDLETQPKWENVENNLSGVYNDIRPLDARSENVEKNLSGVYHDIRPLDAPKNRAVDLVPKCGFSQEDYDLEMIRTLDVTEKIVKEYDNFSVEEIERQVKLEMDKIRKINETTPQRKSKQTSCPPQRDHVKRQILSEQRKPKPKFNLSAVYERVTKKELVNAHRAESDALALLEAVTAIGLPVMEWMDANKKLFRNVNKMW